VVFIDVINVKIRDGSVANRPIYVALAVTCDGERDILGLWAGEHRDGEGAKYWLRVLAETKNRGVADVCIVVCDGLNKGVRDAPHVGMTSQRSRHPARRRERRRGSDAAALPRRSAHRPG
jgi:transposase-like protein